MVMGPFVVSAHQMRFWIADLMFDFFPTQDVNIWKQQNLLVFFVCFFLIKQNASASLWYDGSIDGDSEELIYSIDQSNRHQDSTWELGQLASHMRWQHRIEKKSVSICSLSLMKLVQIQSELFYWCQSKHMGKRLKSNITRAHEVKNQALDKDWNPFNDAVF